MEAVSSHRIKIKLMLVYRYDKTLHMGCAGQCERVGEEILLNSSLLIFTGKYGDYLPIMKMFRMFLRVGNNLRNGVSCPWQAILLLC